MSIKIMARVWESPDVSDRTEALVLLALADFCDDGGWCYPSMATIARKSRMTGRGAQRVMRRLEAAGLIAVHRAQARHGCNRYQLFPPQAEALSAEKSALPPTQGHPDRGSPRPGARHPRPARHLTPTPGSPEPSGTIKNRQQPRARGDAPASTDFDQQALKDLIAAIGGGASDSRLGTSADLKTMQDWRALALSLEAQCEVIERVVSRERGKSPTWLPASLGYFSKPLEEAAKIARNFDGEDRSSSDATAKQRERWRRRAGS